MDQAKKEQIKDAQNEVNKYAVIEAVENSEGGQLIIKGLKKNTMDAIDKVATLYKTAPEIELRTWCALIAERLTLLRLFSRSSRNRKISAAVLDDILKSVEPEEGEG